MEKILVHREIEKQRRQEMSSLYASLRSLLPLEFIQGKRSTSDQVNEAVNYIKYMEKRIKNMNLKRDELTLKCGVSVENLNHVLVVVRPCLVGVEIMFSVLKTRLSSVLEVIREHGLCVVSCISSNVNNRVIYTIQAEVNDLAFVDLGYLKDILTLMM